MNKNSIISTSRVLKSHWFKQDNYRELCVDLLLLEIQDKIKNKVCTTAIFLILLIEKIEFDVPSSLHIFF